MPLRRTSGPPVSGQAPATTYIHKGCAFSGKIRLSESARIDGRVEGEIECGRSLTVGASSRIRATITCESAIVNGEVEGTVTARRKITLQKNAVISGQLHAAGIVIEEGAAFEGQIFISSGERRATIMRLHPKQIPLGLVEEPSTSHEAA